ncbi:MAG TPA: DUF4255 domain-containing protein [Stellaceae bacterium]|nr:DUF4255 domain-containing protein [Stellaceae bacterium]
MAWSTPDLSDITQVLKGLLDYAISHSSVSQGNIKVFCDSPDAARNHDSNCHLTLYLMHVARDPYWRNTPVSGPRPQLNSAQPLSLVLTYLLTAWCDKDFTSEQQAMSIALQTFHSHPIVTQALIQSETLSQWLPKGEFVVSIEPDTVDEISRLWQAFTVPMRLSALIRVSVIFIDPLDPLEPPEPPPLVANLSVAPEPLTTQAPILIRGFGQQLPPTPPDADPSAVTGTIGPLVATAKSTLTIVGNGLDLHPAADDVFLSVPGKSTEWKVTTPWRRNVAATTLELQFPDDYADPTTSLPAPPAAMPLPGFYNLTVGSGTARSNAIPLTIAPRVDKVTDPPVLKPDGAGVYTIAGAGFVPTATKLHFGTKLMNPTATSPPPAGTFTVNAAGTSISFVPPASPKGSYPVLLTVNSIAASSGWVVVLS